MTRGHVVTRHITFGIIVHGQTAYGKGFMGAFYRYYNMLDWYHCKRIAINANEYQLYVSKPRILVT